MATNFKGHIHVHTEYSALDGLAKIEDLIIKAKELGQEFIAITDHGSSTGLYEATLLAQKHNFKTILGEEFYFENSCTELKTGHLILLAKNSKGLRNLFKLQKLAYDNVYYKPRINLTMLKEHSEGLICTTACIANQIGQYILRGETILAVAHILELKEIFGEDLYIELQSSTNEEVITVNKELIKICEDGHFKPIITNDVHYVDKEDAKVHEVLLAIQQKKKMADEKRWRFEQDDFWLKSQSEIEQYIGYIPKDFLQKCYKNIEEINNKCEVVKLESGNFLPKYPVENEDEELERLTNEFYINRIKTRKEANKEFYSDLQKELKVIRETGYSGYFLTVWEYINWAKENGIQVGDGRGSGAGCKVAYTIGITEINPQKYNLLFERFLSPGRQPDFDTDFSDIDAVFRHLQDKYGQENVARVGAISRFTAKSALRKVMSTYGWSQKTIGEIVGLMPKRITFTLEEALNESEELREWLEEHEEILTVVRRFEGKAEHLSTHAGGVIICKGLTEILPTLTQSDDRNKLIVALDKHAIEDLGHYKFDILGLNSLNLLHDTLSLTGEIDWSAVDFEDEKVYTSLCEGDVIGVFQLSEQKEKVQEQQPKCFEDLIAINALIRPGVGDWEEYLNRRRNETTSENMEEYMKPTHGIIVYQDQYLQLAQTYAGWDIAFSDKYIRKNKDIKNDSQLCQKFINDVIEKNDDEIDADKIWSDICDVVQGGYGFNRAHSTSYAKLSFQTAWLKYYHPIEFFSAYLTQNIGDTAKITEISSIIKRKGIKLLTPDINNSGEKFTPKEEGILFPITAIQGVGDSAWQEIKRLRPIKNLEDLLQRRTRRNLKNNAIIALIKAGTLDSIETLSRFEMMKKIDPEAEEKEKYKYERETLGFYVSESPFDKYTLTPYEEIQEGQQCKTIVSISSITERYDRNGNKMAFAIGVNTTDVIKTVVFSNIWKTSKFNEGDIVLLRGKKDKGSLIVNSLEAVG